MGHEDDPVMLGILFFLVVLLVGVAIRIVVHHLPDKLSPPFSVLNFIAGFVLGAVGQLSGHKLGLFGAAITAGETLNPTFILFCLLPPLLFEAASHMDPHIFSRVLSQSVWLAGGPGVILSIAATAWTITKLSASHWVASPIYAVMLAAILAPTDPVAVIAALKKVGAPKRLSALVDGESLLNDAAAFVIYLIVVPIAAHQTETVLDALIIFVKLVFGGLLTGYLMGLLSYYCLKLVFNESEVEVTILFVSIFLTYYVADVWGFSGVLAVVALGLFMAYSGHYVISPEVEETYKILINQMSFVSDTAIFIISGVISYGIFFKISDDLTNFRIWLDLGVLYLVLHVCRFLMLFLSFPLIKNWGYGINMKELLLVSWSGLRGAVSLALGLITQQNRFLDSGQTMYINFFIMGIVGMTIIINGSTVEWLYSSLKLYPINEHYKALFSHAIKQMEEKEMNEVLMEAKKDWLYGKCNLELVAQLVPDFRKTTWKDDTLDLSNCCTRDVAASIAYMFTFRPGPLEQFLASSSRRNELKLNIPLLDERQRVSSETSIDWHRTERKDSGSLHLRHPGNLEPRSLGSSIDLTSRHISEQHLLAEPVHAISIDMKEPTFGSRTPRMSSRNSLTFYSPNVGASVELQNQEVGCWVFKVVQSVYKLQFEGRQLARGSMLVLLEGARIGYDSAGSIRSVSLLPYLEQEWLYLNRLVRTTFPTLAWLQRYPFLSYFGNILMFRKVFKATEVFSGYIRSREQVLDALEGSEISSKSSEDVLVYIHKSETILKQIQRDHPIYFQIVQVILTGKSVFRLS
jgi:NhaP-type Na+/H+ or K+/H+ antiporter